MANRRAFTLIELLVVVSILALLIAILFPSLRRAREQGKRAACAANLRQIGVGFRMYLDQNNDRLPFASYMPSVGPGPLGLDEDPIYFADLILPFAGKQKKVFQCPADKPGRFQRDPPNDGKSYCQSERSSYEYRTGFGRGFTIMGLSTLEAAKRIESMLARFGPTPVPENSFWIVRDYNNFHGEAGEPGSRRYLYSDGRVADFENY